MAHKVHYFENCFDGDGTLRPSRTIETDNAAEAERLVCAEMARQTSMMAADVHVDWRLCETIQEYIYLGNTCARWLEENPIEGCFMSQLTNDPAHWLDRDVTTPEELEKYRLLNGYSDHYKEVHGSRPRHHGMTMETPIEEIEAAYDRLTTLETSDQARVSP
jgi:hypothetical protein